MKESVDCTSLSPTLRRCRKCSQERNVAEFRPDKQARNGKLYPRNQCRECEARGWRRDWLAGKKGRQSAVTLAVKAPRVPAPELSIESGIEAKLEDAILQRMRLYQSDALDALHDLAMMPISENSMQNQVKLAAAWKLAGPLFAPDAPSGRSDLDKTLREMNELYHKTAPRIKSIREHVVMFEQGQPATTGRC
jgi:hypothetical protein